MSAFQFRPVLTIATLISVGILLSLGIWQVKRLQWKLDLIEKVEARAVSTPISLAQAQSARTAGDDLEYQPVSVTGLFVHEKEAHVFGTWEGAPGWYIMTPLRLSAPGNGEALLMVNRGFVPLALKEQAARPQSLTQGEVTLTGLYRSSKKPGGISARISPSDMAPKDRNEFHSRDVDAFSAYLGLDLIPFLLDASEGQNTAPWPQAGTTRLTFNNRHLEYALTWFGLAATLIVIFFVFSRKPKKPAA